MEFFGKILASAACNVAGHFVAKPIKEAIENINDKNTIKRAIISDISELIQNKESLLKYDVERILCELSDDNTIDDSNIYKLCDLPYEINESLKGYFLKI